MKSYSIEFSARAESDVASIYEYIAAHGPADPDDWKAGLQHKLATLRMMPESCSLAPEHDFSSLTIRQLIYHPFRILFEVRESVVFVLTVRHGARQFLAGDEMDRLT